MNRDPAPETTLEITETPGTRADLPAETGRDNKAPTTDPPAETEALMKGGLETGIPERGVSLPDKPTQKWPKEKTAASAMILSKPKPAQNVPSQGTTNLIASSILDTAQRNAASATNTTTSHLTARN